MNEVALTWRLLIEDNPSSGRRNMAVDRAILAARVSGVVPPTLRIYGWERPTVTLGRFQDVSGVDTTLCRERGIDVVRRHTGGRGVLHHDELTYSVIASAADGVPRGVAASYRYLCRGLAAAYRYLGMDAQLTRRDRGNPSSSACYLHSTAADLSFGARKLSGSAQVWEADAVLQHGSFTISRDVALEAAIFKLAEEDARALEAATATLSQRAAGVPGKEEVVKAVVRGFAEELGITLQVGVFTDEEEVLSLGFEHDAIVNGA